MTVRKVVTKPSERAVLALSLKWMPVRCVPRDGA
jgi:hypothetical protein